jgi:uncharacterized protein (TIGR02246 family)
MTPGNSAGSDADARALYARILDTWNKRDARNYALCFATDANLVGFDGSQIDGQQQIGAHVSEIFAHHQTGRYVSIVRETREIAPGVVLLRGVAGLVPADKEDINPELNAVQTLVGVRDGGELKGALFQNTPAKFDMRPELATKLTAELRAALKAEAKPV